MLRCSAWLALFIVAPFWSPLAEQFAARIYVAPESPTTADAVKITVGDVCVSFIQAPRISQQVIRIDGLPFSTCPLSPPTLNTQTFLVGPLPLATYTVNVYENDRLSSVRQFDVRPASADVLFDASPLVFLDHFRFRVEASWHDPRVGAGGGTAYGRQLTDGAAYFWFFNADDTELTVRVLDGRFVNGHFWVFIASATDLGFDVTVTDTGDGLLQCAFPSGAATQSKAPLAPVNCPSRTYHGTPGRNQNFLDVGAF